MNKSPMPKYYIITETDGKITARRAEHHLSNNMYSPYGEIDLAELPLAEIVAAVVDERREK